MIGSGIVGVQELGKRYLASRSHDGSAHVDRGWRARGRCVDTNQQRGKYFAVVIAYLKL